MADDDINTARQEQPASDEDALLHPWADQPEAKSIPLPKRIPSLAELERMLVILSMVNRWGDEDALPPVMN